MTTSVDAWAWSAILVVITITIHVSGLAAIALVVPRFWTEDVSDRKTFLDTVPGAVSAITAIALVLAVLHGVEALIWSIAFVRLGVLNSMADAILYSLGAMTTVGSGIIVQLPWRIMGAVESLNGVLLFGISTASLFSLMTFLWRTVSSRRWRINNRPGK
ncbi:MAG TPA: ion channel [Candidatus Baltobacteraceae bacterium]|nr:ion channel [Candidatus Baltobacteraceae bacterium]